LLTHAFAASLEQGALWGTIVRNVRSSPARLARIAASIVALMVAWPLLVHAAARVVVPAGWWESSGAAPEAQRRAGRWKDALGLRLVQVVSAPDDDRFAETAAVFEHDEPVPEQAFASEASAVETLSGMVTNLVGAQPPDEAELRMTAAGGEVVWARWHIEELDYECVLAPSGESASLVVMVVLASELDEQRATLDGIVAGLEGVSEPMPRFSLLGWRIGSLLVWLALSLGLHAVMLRYVDQDNDHGTAGRRASLINLGLVLVGTLVAYFALAGRELAIVHAGSSLAGLTVWIAVAGIIVVGGHFLLASRLDRGVVRSAPSSGAFASGSYSTAEVLRASVSRSGMRMRDLAETSDSWPRAPQPQAADPAASGRIIIDEAERE
jgi:hypothetical protein